MLLPATSRVIELTADASNTRQKGTTMHQEMPAEFGMEVGQSESGYELGNEMPGESAFEYSGEFGNEFETGQGEQSAMELQEMELASSLLEVTSEQELDRFLGNLISRATKTIGGIARSPVGQALGGILKQAARKALPVAGQALGSYIGGPAGGRLGQQLASTAGKAFGLELEGLSNEDREFETAKQYVRFANDAARRAAAHVQHHRRHSGPVAPAAVRQIARSAAVTAAKRYAPGLVTAIAARGAGPNLPTTVVRSAPGSCPPPLAALAAVPGPMPAHFSTAGPSSPTSVPGAARPRSGRWHRKGRQVFIHGV
jgi:hypothetical protein